MRFFVSSLVQVNRRKMCTPISDDGQTQHLHGPARMTLIRTLAPLVVEIAISGAWLCRLLLIGLIAKSHRLPDGTEGETYWRERRLESEENGEAGAAPGLPMTLGNRREQIVHHRIAFATTRAASSCGG